MIQARLIAYGLSALVAVGGLVWVYNHIYDKGIAECKAEEQAKFVEAMTIALEAERAKQKEVDRALQEQTKQLADIRRRHAAELERLRQRPSRNSLSEDARAKCEASTGAELSREDGAFLAGEAARADELRTALRRCYEYADTVSRMEAVDGISERE